MLRLTTVFLVWLASTAYAFDERRADADVELHLAYLAAWSANDDDERSLLEKSQRGWYKYRAGHCALLGEECFSLMAHERAVELRLLVGLTKTHDRTIVPRHDGGRSKQR
jgi:uncharacterized protein YecT (DUF1311 family)